MSNKLSNNEGDKPILKVCMSDIERKICHVLSKKTWKNIKLENPVIKEKILHQKMVEREERLIFRLYLYTQDIGELTTRYNKHVTGKRMRKLTKRQMKAKITKLMRNGTITFQTNKGIK